MAMFGLYVICATLLGSDFAQADPEESVRCTTEVADLSIPLSTETYSRAKSQGTSFVIFERQDMTYVALVEPKPEDLLTLSGVLKNNTRSVFLAVNSIHAYTRPEMKSPLGAYRVSNGINPSQLKFVTDDSAEYMIPVLTARGSIIMLPATIRCHQN